MPAHQTPFLDFPDPLPSPRAAIDAVYFALSGYKRPTAVACSDCFDQEAERRIVQDVPLRSLPPADFGMILSEHIDCSVGVEGFLYFLPRLLETFGLEWLGPGLGERIATAGGPRLPRVERAALAGCLGRGAVGVAIDGDAAPLGEVSSDGTITTIAGRNVVGDIGARMVHGLLAVRVEPRQVFARLLATDGANLGHVLAELVDKASFVTPYATRIHARHPDHPAPEPALRAIDAIARNDFLETVTPDRFEAALARCDRRLPSRKRERVAERYRTLADGPPGPPRKVLVAQLAEALASPAPSDPDLWA